jgi:hypothetical protein
MKEIDDLSRVIQRLNVPASVELDERIRGAISQAEKPGSVAVASDDASLRQLLKLVMKNKSIRYSLSTVLGLVFLATVLLNPFTTSAWALEQAIEALQKYNAVRMTGYTTAGGSPAPTEFWARADVNGTRSDECLVRSDSFTAWVKENRTYVYDHARHTVFVEPAITMGLNPWLGPKLLETLSKMPDYTEFEGHDPATGAKRMMVTASLESASGPQSFLIEFDVRTKLPVSMKHWLNRNQQGAPDFTIDKIVYFEDLPDSTFRFQPPAGVLFEEKPLTIPEANLAMLSHPNTGMPADGLTREEACRMLLEQFWAAVINDDLARLHQLCPVTATWPDRLLRDVVAEDHAVELLEIGSIEKRGQSKLGPLALVPSRVRCLDGKVREVKIIVQFRRTEQGESCVIHGNYGYSVEVE